MAFVVSLNLHRRHLTREQRDEVIRQLRTNGMTLQKIADAVGVSYSTAQRAVPDYSNEYSEIVNARGQMRPMHYASRTVELEANDENDDEPEPFHYEVYDEGGGQFSLTVGPDEEIAMVNTFTVRVAKSGSIILVTFPQDHQFGRAVLRVAD